MDDEVSMKEAEEEAEEGLRLGNKKKLVVVRYSRDPHQVVV